MKFDLLFVDKNNVAKLKNVNRLDQFIQQTSAATNKLFSIFVQVLFL